MSKPDEVIRFGTLQPDGSVTNERAISKLHVLACKHFILTPEHYREDGSCRCDDPDHNEMIEWGYTWEEEVGWVG